MKTLTLLLLGMSLFLVSPSCKTTGTPPPVGSGGGAGEGPDGSAAPINCVSDVARKALADAESRAVNVISSGVTSGYSQDKIVVNLEALATDLVPGALECALQYLGIKLDFDARHADGQVAKEKAAESQVARAYIRKHSLKFATPPVSPTVPVN